jgi:hypothetical protein
MDAQKSAHHGIHAVAPPERRREWREYRRIPVEVSGFDARGRFFTERTSTFDVSNSGCSFLLNYELEESSAVSVRVIRRRNGTAHNDPPVLFRVTWTRQTHPGWPKWTVAGEKMQPVEPWTVGFPAGPDDSVAHTPKSPGDTPPAA